MVKTIPVKAIPLRWKKTLISKPKRCAIVSKIKYPLMENYRKYRKNLSLYLKKKRKEYPNES